MKAPEPVAVTLEDVVLPMPSPVAVGPSKGAPQSPVPAEGAGTGASQGPAQGSACDCGLCVAPACLQQG